MLSIFKLHTKRTVSVARGLAVAFLVAEWEPESMAVSAKRLFSRSQPWLLPLAQRVCENFSEPLVVKPTLESIEILERFISVDQVFRDVVKIRNLKRVDYKRVTNGRPLGSLAWRIPQIENVVQLAGWLGISRRDLVWLADLNSKSFDPGFKRSCHYAVSTIGKRSGGIRLIESPKPRLKQVQRMINDGILSRISPHSAAHGFCRGRSVLSYVKPHVGKPFCLKLDLKDFFPTIKFGRVFGLFKSLGFPREVAYHLAGLCTLSLDDEALFLATGVPQTSFSKTKHLYEPRHLPQGAPTSPAVANLIAYKLDCRLAGLAKSAGARFTRYADDLLFSGSERLAASANSFVTCVGAIAIEEGFEVNFRKTRFMRAGQRQKATGIVFNERLNLERKEYDRLKATLNNCVRLGAASQNRDGIADFKAHLAGRIAWVRQLNPRRAKKLQALFAKIEW